MDQSNSILTYLKRKRQRDEKISGEENNLAEGEENNPISGGVNSNISINEMKKLRVNPMSMGGHLWFEYLDLPLGIGQASGNRPSTVNQEKN